ncbi:MAG: DUF4296 domain-containing protein [Odoribacteraceae bacterium]|jgi:hypothetical protein|nr:DUF4296 domain-containing protein [Odoribacteraceae bacterium]
MNRGKILLALVAALFVVVACSRAPLGERRFTALLIDLHTADAILSDARVAPISEQEKRAYYAGLFEKYGITRVDFDSCVRYYAGTNRYERIYEAVTRELNRRDTANLLVWAELTREDTVNLAKIFTVNTRDTLVEEYIRAGMEIIDTLYAIVPRARLVIADTLPINDINPCYRVDLDSLRAGYYEMRMRVKFDTATTNSRVRALFISPDGDTVRVREILARKDPFPREYTWNYYLTDSARHDRLHVDILEPDSADATREGWITGLKLYRKFLPPKEARRVIEQQQLWQQRRR